MDFRFAWAPSGKALFFERSFRGARNLWRMTVDPATLQPTNVERLTTSRGTRRRTLRLSRWDQARIYQ